MRHEPIGKELFITNRRQLFKKLPPGSLVVFNSNDIMPSNADGTLGYIQNSDLYYMSGIHQEDSMVVLCPGFPDKKYREVLFIKEPNELMEKWEGHKLTKKEATEISGIETVVWLSGFEKLFHHMMTMGGVNEVYLNTNEHYRSEVMVQSRDARFIEWCKKTYPLHRYERIAPVMGELRRVKQPREIELIQKACDITECGFRRVLNYLRPGVMEYELEAEFIHEFKRLGSKGFAYTPIIASGENNVILHYVENSRQCHTGDLVLLDVAAEYANYNSDLTRTIPVSGRYSKRQRDVYNAVLRIEREAFKMLRPSVVYFDYQKEIEKLMQSELLTLKLIDKTDIKNQSADNPAYRKYFYHGTSHMLGLDVHDVGNMHDKVQVGSVWTIEPGIYIKEEKFGIRLENNVVIGKSKNVDLMSNIPIEADEIEEIMNSKTKSRKR
ncbi:MAG: aminopeptidase P N-terminal domain-containing protein [Flammeovirgaceae bacterium]|nr:aminopeptidase P N-terminal domain-containing protein [Flammeovirgaceae bacterium]